MDEVGFDEFLDRSRSSRVLLLDLRQLLASDWKHRRVWVDGELVVDLAGESALTEVGLEAGVVEEVGSVVVWLSSGLAFSFERRGRESLRGSGSGGEREGDRRGGEVGELARFLEARGKEGRRDQSTKNERSYEEINSRSEKRCRIGRGTVRSWL